MKSIYIGTSGYNYKHWKERFYPKEIPVKQWMEYYSKHFKTVEINATFYGHFKKTVFENWANRTPKDFVFTLKGPRYITHVKRLVDPKESIDYFLNEAVGLEEKLSLILWQFPPSFKLIDENYERLENFLSMLPKINQALEFRHKTWFDDKVFRLMDQKGVGFVINDSSRFPAQEIVTGNIAYVRFHGPTSLYSSEYSKEQLKEWSKKIKKYAKDREVYCYFNNDNNAYAIKNAKELRTMLE
jgi:uncharacterized protein YecE (DUF72 family)